MKSENEKAVQEIALKLGLASGYMHTGSREICPEKAAEHADDDWLVLSDQSRKITTAFMKENGFSANDSKDYELNVDGVFESYTEPWKRGNLNIIMIYDELTYDRWRTATLTAKQLRLCTRPERVILFKAMRYAGLKR